MNTKEKLKTFCRNVTRLRAEYGYTKKVMANKLGISVYSLNSIEKGVVPKRLRADVLLNIHDEFGILPSEIMREYGAEGDRNTDHEQ